MIERVPAATLVVLALLVALLLQLAFARSATAEVPPGFSDELVTQVDAPTAVAFTPDERMLITTQPGQLRVRDGGVLLSNPALNLGNRICSNSERGLLGVAVDPQFTTNNFIYLYYTFDRSGTCVNRVERYTLSPNNVATSSKILIDNIPSTGGNHNGGDLHFGKDGFLYVSVGDAGRDYAGDSGSAGQNDAARDKHVLLGKILRITRGGAIPSTNPYRGADSGRCNVTGRTAAGDWCQETFAWGLRNPFRFAFDPNASGTRFFINDVGQNAWEEVDKGKAGADYAWNFCEGRNDNPDRPGSRSCASAPYTAPVHQYSHSTGCSSITGGAFVPNGLWPDSYDGSYLYADYACGKIFKLTRASGGGYESSEFATRLGDSSAVAMTFGPSDGERVLYYTTYQQGGEVRRIEYVGAPTAAVSASPTSAPDVPLTVDFDGSGSSDPNGDALAYLWSFGDGTSAETDSPTTNHTYNDAGEYDATLRVRNPTGATSTPATVRIAAGNEPPSPSIQEPAKDARFRVGQEITLSGAATDPEDGPLPEANLSWKVVQHHNATHTHPYDSGTGKDLTIETPPPEDLKATGQGNYLEIRLTATDSKGAISTVTQRLRPKRVPITFQTAPINLDLLVNGSTDFSSPTLVSWPGYELNVEAPRQEDGSGRVWVFESWSDGRPAKHTIVTPASAATYTATFRRPAN